MSKLSIRLPKARFRTLDVFVVSSDGLRLTRAGSSFISLPCSILSIIHVSPPPSSRLFKLGFKQYPEDPCHQPPQTYFASQQVVNLVSDVGGNPLRHPSLNHGFMNLASDVGGNPLRRSALSHFFCESGIRCGNPLRHPAMSHQKLVRSCCRRTTFTSLSIVESTSIPCLLSMNGENFSDSFSSFSFSLLTGLLPCGEVCTGPESAIENTPVFLVGEDCLSTSLVTISQLFDFVVEALSTHSNLVLNLLGFIPQLVVMEICSTKWSSKNNKSNWNYYTHRQPLSYVTNIVQGLRVPLARLFTVPGPRVTLMVDITFIQRLITNTRRKSILVQLRHKTLKVQREKL
ncbi:LOW QUALITY PROTEIN: hypothetical protein YC2023_069418 [Brassica napus]